LVIELVSWFGLTGYIFIVDRELDTADNSRPGACGFLLQGADVLVRPRGPGTLGNLESLAISRWCTAGLRGEF
jgi:hypothetical protein